MILLDTCAIIWIANREPISVVALDVLVKAGLAGGILVSPVSAWEIGLLSRPKPNRQSPQFSPDPKAWFTRFASGTGVVVSPLTPDIAIDASHLPGAFHSDPMDRLLVSTARHLGFPIVTRDHKILDYAMAGHVEAIAC